MAKIRTEQIENLTTADVTASTDKNYVTDAQATVIGNTSGTNTGDQTTITGNAGTATALQTARTIGGVSFDGTANITVASATGGFTVSGGALALGSQNITSTGSIGATGAGKLTKVWTVDLESTNMPTVGGTSLSSTFSPIAGSASITTVGTIGTGTWQGTAIGDTYISSAATWNAKQSAITFGTGVQTALGVNIGSAGAPILFNGAGGTPSSMVGTNITGTASGLTAGAVTGFTAGAGTLTGPASSGVAVTLGNNETITGVKTMSGLNSVLVSSSGLTVRNPANTFKYTITGAAIAADRQLNLPLITGTATLACLSLAQTYTATQTFTSPVTTTSITTGSTSFTAWAGATTLLTIGGTGASASMFMPSTLDTSSSTTGAIRTSGGISAAKAMWVGTKLTVASSIDLLAGSINLAENTSIALDPAGSADGKWTGITVTGVSDYSQAFGDLVYLKSSNSRWAAADADADTTADRMLAMVVVTGTSGNSCTLLLQGIIRADAKFPTMTIGSAMYVGETAGAIQVAIPTGADNVIRRVGYAMTADELYFNPSMDSQTTVA